MGLKNPKPAELLFAVHTYYALFMKLLAAEIIAFFHKLPTPLHKMMQATTSNYPFWADFSLAEVEIGDEKPPSYTAQLFA